CATSGGVGMGLDYW
nr:immunoglobulin heavy chain junction region [Macaca mulatta]